jgi:hypothetical protein
MSLSTEQVQTVFDMVLGDYLPILMTDDNQEEQLKEDFCRGILLVCHICQINPVLYDKEGWLRVYLPPAVE